MARKTYARVQAGTVVELFHTDADIRSLFHEALVWIDVTDTAARVGWTQAGQSFVPPPIAAASASTAHQPSLAELQAQLAALGAQLAALQASGSH